MGTVVTLKMPVVRDHRPAGTNREGTVAGTVSPSRDRVNAAVARQPCLSPLREACASGGDVRCVRRERILATLLDRLPGEPADPEMERVSHLASCDYPEIYAVQRNHVDDPIARQLHLILLPAWADLDGEERYFAQRCAVALVEALYGQRNKGKLTA